MCADLRFELRATLWNCVQKCLQRGFQNVIIKPIQYWLVRCSGLHMYPHVSLAAAYLSLKNEETGLAWPIFRRRSSIWKVLNGIWTYAHRCLPKNASLISSPTFNGMDKVVWRFIAKADRRKSSKINLNLSMPKRTPKRRSPNIGERKLKWAITVSWAQIVRQTSVSVSPNER